jgi:glucose/arabinose dehydrogenase
MPRSIHSSRSPLIAVFVLAAVVLGGCTRQAMVRNADASAGASGLMASAGQAVPECDADNAGITVPDGFCALVFADELGSTRNLVVAPNGDVFVARRASRDGGGGGITALRDSDGDGRADVFEQFGDTGGTGINLFEGYLYLAPDDGIIRYPMAEGSLTPSGPGERIVEGLPGPGTGHAAKSAAIDPDGNVYVNLGGPSNACQVESRTAGSPGHDPCPQLENRGGTWRFDARRPGQTQADGSRFATGLRNTFALAIQPGTGELWGAQHGRDGLFQLWGELFTADDQAEMPAEEFVHIQEGDNFGWPYCYYDPIRNVKVLGPEYGGDGTEVGRCADMKNPAVALPAHWAPNGLAFYTGAQFPERYRGGAFIAFHGSWNRAPLPQGGYNVVFIEFDGNDPTGEWDVFADGFAGEDVSPGGAAHRPAGVAVGPDGSLYVSDDRGGRIYRIVYTGE